MGENLELKWRREAKQIFDKATNLARDLRHKNLQTEHLLAEFLEYDKNSDFLQNLGIDIDALKKKVNNKVRLLTPLHEDKEMNPEWLQKHLTLVTDEASGGEKFEEVTPLDIFMMMFDAPYNSSVILHESWLRRQKVLEAMEKVTGKKPNYHDLAPEEKSKKREINVTSSKSVFKNGDYVNIRNIDVGMTIILPKVVDGAVQTDNDEKLIWDSDIILSKADDDLPFEIHLIGTKKEYILRHLDLLDSPLNSENSYLMKTDYGREFGFYNDKDGNVCVRPKIVSFQSEKNFEAFYVVNDNPEKDEDTEQYTIVVKPLENQLKEKTSKTKKWDSVAKKLLDNAAENAKKTGLLKGIRRAEHRQNRRKSSR